MTPAANPCSRDLQELKTLLAADAAGLIAREEARYTHQIHTAADAIADAADSLQFVWMCGPSSVGKTTTARRLCAALENRGVQAFVVSLDDFYRGVGKAPLLEDGSYDYESPKALDLPQLHRCLTELAATGETDLPRYDFAAGKPGDCRTFLRVTGRAAVIFEGIQAFSPLLTEGLGDLPVLSLRLFINTRTRFTDGDKLLLCRRDIRLVRRLLRDERTRATSFADTMAMWQKVLTGDERHIFPYSDGADLLIDTALGYEPCVTAPLIADKLTALYGTPYEATARRLQTALAQFPALPQEIVPADSILREFIGNPCTF